MEKVLVTGISGYLGQHCAAALLKEGYAVLGSVRNLNKTENITVALKGYQNTPVDNLSFCELNLLDDKGWADAMSQCDYVLHVASPFVAKEPKNEDELIQPAVEGTMRALRFAHDAKIKKIVVTSSMVAMLGDCNADLSIEQSTWTNVKAKNASAYIKSKTIAEESAWSFINSQSGDYKLQMTTIHPGPIYGPSINGNLNGESMTMIKNMITGKMPMVPKGAINISDVRDVAKMHVAALKNPASDGQRFVVATDKAHSFLELTHILKDNGFDKVSTKAAPTGLMKFMALFNKEAKGMKAFIGNTYNANTKATRDTFNWNSIPLKDTMLDTANAIQKVI